MASSAKERRASAPSGGSSNAGLVHDSSAITQATERTDARLSGTRSRALSSLLSINTVAVMTPLEMATARGPLALFCFKVRDSQLARALLIAAVLLDFSATVVEASSTRSPLLTLSAQIPMLFGFICVVITGAVSRGLWDTREAYLRSWPGWLDTIVLMNSATDVIFLIGLVAGCWNYTPVTLGIFAVLRNMRAWVVLRICRTFRAAIRNVARSASDLAAVGIFVLVFSVLVLIVLMHFYGFASWYRCYPNLPLPSEVQATDSCSAGSFFWDADDSQPRLCSNSTSPCKEGTSCRNIFIHSVSSSCSPEERRELQERAWFELHRNEEGAFGVLGLQTLGAAAATLLQGFTLEGWAITMQRHVDADQRSRGVIAYLVFPSMVVIGGMLLMNLAIAVLWEGFDAATAEQTSRPSILQESEWRVYQLLGADWIKYLMVQLGENWEAVLAIKRGRPSSESNGESQEFSGLCSRVRKKLFDSLCTLQQRFGKLMEMHFPVLKRKLSLTSRKLKLCALNVATHRFAAPIMLTVVAADMTCLLVESGKPTGLGFTLVYIVTTAVFTFEAIVLMLAFGRKGMRDWFIRFDILTACLGLADGIMALCVCQALAGCRAAMSNAEGAWGTVGIILTVLRPVRIFKVVKYFSTLRMTAEMLCALQISLFRHIALVFYLCSVMTQLGLLLFFDPSYSTRCRQVQLGATKYFNFENFGNAMLLLLAIMTGEGWDLIFEELAQVYGWEAEQNDFAPGTFSGIVLATSFRVSAINTFLYVALLFLNCLVFNFYGAVMIGNFLRTQRCLTVEYAAKFIVTCRKAGIAMPAEDALQGEKAQALYALVDMTTDAQRDEIIRSILSGSDHGRSAKAFGEFARKTSLAFDICKTVARKGSHIAARTSSDLGLDDKGISQSNYHSCPAKRSSTNQVSNDLDFDKAVADRGVFQRHGQVKSIPHASRGNGGVAQPGGVHMLERGAGRAVIQEKTKPASASSPVDHLVAQHPAAAGTPKVAVQFAPKEQTVFLPAHAHKAPAIKSGDKPDEDLQFNELCHMFCIVMKDAARQVLVAMTAAVKAALKRISPVDPSSPALQMACVCHLISEAPDVKEKREPVGRPQKDSWQSTGPGLSSQCEVGPSYGSNHSMTLRKRSTGRGGEPPPEVRQMSSWMKKLLTAKHAAKAHLHNVCGINGYGWLQLTLQSISLAELVVDTAMKKDRCLDEVFAYVELAFQTVLTLELAARFGFSERIRFFSSRINYWELFLQSVAWCSLALPLSKSHRLLGTTLSESAAYRVTKCTRVLRSLWLLRLWKGTGTNGLALALQAASRRILNLGIIFVLLVTFFAVDFRYVFESAAGDAPNVPPTSANLTSLGESVLSVFILTTSEGWPRVLASFLDLADRHRAVAIVLCLLVVALLSVFVLNLFVGIIVDVLEKEQTNLDCKRGASSAVVLRWNEVQRAVFGAAKEAEVAERRGGLVRGKGFGAADWFSHFLTSKQLDLAVAVISLGSCLTMLVGGAWAETDVRWVFPSYQKWIFWINALIVIGYVIEQALRLSFLKKSVFQKSIYVIDLAVAVSSAVALFVALSRSLQTPFPAEPLWPVAFRMLRVAYVACQRLPVMRVISITMLNVIGALGRVLVLLCGIILLYGLLGTCLFHDAPIDPKLHSSFATLFDTTVLLMSCCTGENWHNIMLQARAFYYKNGSSVLGSLIVLYAVTFVALTYLLLMNVFMSTVLKGYVDTKRNQSLWRVAQQHQDLLTKWKLREMKLSWLPVHVAVQVLTDIPPPVGFKNQYLELGGRRMDAVLAVLSTYSLPVHKNSVHIRDVVLVTTCRACEAHAQRKEVIGGLDPLQHERVQLNPRLVTTWMDRFTDIAGFSPEFNILQYLACLHIQAFWRTRQLLHRNSTADQLRYMGHLLFLLETTGPICARKPPRSDNRRSTVRRKRATKRGGSFAHRTTALSRLGTFARSSRTPQQQPTEKLRNASKQMERPRRPSNFYEERISLTAAVSMQRPSAVMEDDVLSHTQKQPGKFLQRSTASECIIEISEARRSKHAGQRADRANDEVSIQQLPKGEEISARSGLSEGDEIGACRGLNTKMNIDEVETASVGDGHFKTTQLLADTSKTSARHSSNGQLQPAQAGYPDCHLVFHSPSLSNPNATSSALPARSRSRTTQPPLRLQLPRGSQQTFLVQHVEQCPTPEAGSTRAVLPSSGPSRRRGQSVQFTGLDRLELQRLLAPAQVLRDGSQSTGGSEDSG
ncbi:hypothetical protein ACSSS7_006896 [Eimeria intestinalis]